MKFNYENLYRKSPKPLWFRTFLRLISNRFALLVAGEGCGCPVDTSVHSTEAPTEAAVETSPFELFARSGS